MVQVLKGNIVQAPALGELQVRQEDGRTVFDVGGFSSAVATLPQPDGSLAFVTIDPVAAGFAFVRARPGRRAQAGGPRRPA